MSICQAILLVVQSLVFSYWIVTFLFYFDRRGVGKSAELRLLGALATFFMCAETFVVSTQRLAVLNSALATLVYLGSSALLSWSLLEAKEQRLRVAFMDATSQKLLFQGPYGLIRHPIYASYIIGWLAFSIAAYNLSSVVPVIVMTCFYVRAAACEETHLLSDGKRRELYQDYMRRTGMFTPHVIGSRRT